MKILFGVFDWGIGHATRDMPLVDALLKEKHTVHFISTGRALSILQKKFKNRCQYFNVPSIYVPYSKTRFFQVSFSAKIPKMLLSLKKAREHSKEIIKKEKYDLIISDCRYDVYGEREKSWLINHQLRFKSQLFEWFTKRYLAKQMHHYTKVLVPDYPDNPLTGKLSKNDKYKKEIIYLGIISALKKRRLKEDIDYFISLSGPEPQRSVLEEKLRELIPKLNGKIVFTLGKPEAKKDKKTQKLEMYPFLNAKKQEEMMNRAKCIISRPGYTTVMDLIELEKKKVLFIPTPGQTEQEYLADLYEKKGWFPHISQYNKEMQKEVAKLKNAKGFMPPWKTKESIKKFLAVIANYEKEKR